MHVFRLCCHLEPVMWRILLISHFPDTWCLLLFLHLTGVNLCILLSRKDVTISACQVQEKIHSWLWGKLAKNKNLFHLTQALPSTGFDVYYALASTVVIQQICIHPTPRSFPVYIRPRNHHKLIPFSLPTGCLHLTNYSGGWIHSHPWQGGMDASLE